MKEFIVNRNKDIVDQCDGIQPHFQRITVLRTVKNMFTGETHYQILVEDQSGYVEDRWIGEFEFNEIKELATYDMRPF